MRSVSYLAIFSGAVALLIVLSTPFIVKWELSRALAPYGATEIAPQLTQERLDDLAVDRFVSGILGVVVIVAGVLIWRRRPIGNHILALASASILALNVWVFVTAPQSGLEIGAVMRFGWWLFVLVFSIVKGKKYGASWWAA